ncbi:alpha/beta hydrolase [Rickettsiales bacterium LUAb2]
MIETTSVNDINFKDDYSFYLKGSNGKVILLIHGLTGAPVEMKALAKLFNAKGFSVYAPLLYGHGNGIKNLITTTWQDWYTDLEKHLKLLSTKYQIIYTAGICVGGSLGLMLAKNNPNIVKAVTIFSPTLKYNGTETPWWYGLSNYIMNTLVKIPAYRKVCHCEKHPFGIKNDRLRNLIINSSATPEILDCYPAVVLNEYLKMVKVLKKSLPLLKTPLLLIQSIEDDVSSYKNSLTIQKLYGGLCEVYLLNNSYHLIHVDQQKSTVANQTSLFFNNY